MALTEKQKQETMEKVNQRKLQGLKAISPLGGIKSPEEETFIQTTIENVQPEENNDTVPLEEEKSWEDTPLPGVDEYAQFATPESMSVVPYQELSIVEGLSIPPTMTEDQKDKLLESIFSYVGVTPQKIDSKINRWLKCLGCAVMPLQKEQGIDEETGEVQVLQWHVPLFKLDIIDQDTGSHIIVSGGGKNGLRFARSMTTMFGAGDWSRPKWIRFNQENRVGEDGQPRRLYRVEYRITEPKN